MPVPGIKNPSISYGSTIVVTGCSGFIGSHVADQVLSAGYKVRGTSRDAQKNKWLSGYFDSKYGEGKFDLISVPDPSVRHAFDEVVKGTKSKWTRKDVT